VATKTPRYSFWKPTIDGGEGEWGEQTNQNWDWLDAYLIEEPASDGKVYGRVNNAGIRYWALMEGGGGSFPDAPPDGQDYARNGLDELWVPAYNKTDADTRFAPIGHVGSTDVVEGHPLVTLTVPGFMSPGDKEKLDEISGANLAGAYKKKTTAGGVDPTAGYVALNNANASLVTVMDMSHYNQTGGNNSLILVGLGPGDIVLMTGYMDPTDRYAFEIASNTPFTSYISLTGTMVLVEGAIADEDEVNLKAYPHRVSDAPNDGKQYARQDEMWEQVLHGLMPDITEDQHHAKQHSITDLAHHIFPAVPTGTNFLRDDGVFAFVEGGGTGGVTDHAQLTGVTPDQHHPEIHDYSTHTGLPVIPPPQTFLHADLTDVSPDQHHPEIHDYSTHTGLPVIPPPQTFLHADLTDVSPDQHHPQAHAHNGLDGSGQIAHASTTGQTPDDHHPQIHLLTSHSDVETTENPLKHGQGLWWDSVRLVWENRSSFTEAYPTGLADGGELNIVAGQIEAVQGGGVIVDSWTEPLSPPALMAVQWPTQQMAITAAPALAGSIVWFSMASSGVPAVPPQFGGIPVYTGLFKQYAQRPNPTLARSEIFLGVAVHNGAEWKEASNPKVVNQSVETLRELLTAVLPISHIIGGGATHSELSFQLSQDEGIIWEQNRNWHNDKSDPNRETLPAANPILFRYVNRDFTSVSALTPTVNPALYDNGSPTPQPVPGSANATTIQRLYLDLAGNYWMLYGQNVYDTFEIALANINADTYNTVVPGLLQASILLGGVISEHAKADWDPNEAVWYPSSGTAGGGGGGSPITDHDNLNGITTDNHHNKDHDHKGLGTIASAPKIPHTDLADVLPDQHHAQAHEWNGADHLNMPSEFPPSTHTHDHATLTNVLPDQHHPEIHDYSSHTGLPYIPPPQTYLHGDLTDVTEDQHHAKFHDISDQTHHGFPEVPTLLNFLRDDGTFAVPPGSDQFAILAGQVPPAPATGEPGDYYIDDATDVMYGPKASSGVDPWPILASLGGGSSGVTDHNQLTGVTENQHHAKQHSITDLAHHTFPAAPSLTKYLRDDGTFVVPYTHPAYTARNADIDSGPLTGATVISDIDLNVNSDTQGHITSANFAYATRVLTLANLGYTGDSNANNYVHQAYTARNADIDTLALTGATVISDLDMNVVTDAQGHVTAAAFAVATRTLTLANLGYTGDPNANNYVHPAYTARTANATTGDLTGATVISKYNLSLTSDAQGHITAASVAYATRTLTLTDLGYVAYVHPAYTPLDDFIVTGALTGATVISDLTINITSDSKGHLITNVLSYAVRQLTLANLGYTGDSNANNYVHPAYTARNADIDTLPMTGAKVISDLDMNLVTDAQGHVTGASFQVATRNLTTADIGAAKTSAGVITPSFIGAATGGAVSGTVVWVTVGNLVMVTGQIKWTTAPTGTGQVRIGTLPYANDYETGFGYSGDKVQGNRTEENGMFLTMYAAAKDCRMWNVNDAGNREAVVYNDITASGSININFSYYSSEVPA